ncbi:hypothetical protein AB1Y20_004505 [Prymnesium parvum]|uniref:J domain-containing protein n=1 Tax=Prymnesium parvum TaxID=97485 RepID=A0AB34IWZ6_PRYPA
MGRGGIGWLALVAAHAAAAAHPRPPLLVGSHGAPLIRPARLPRCPPLRALADDPYDILAVPRDATGAQIKQAYRRLALRSHPDVNKAPDAQQTFARIAEAYALLSDPEKRRQYDARSSFASGPGRASGRSGWPGASSTQPRSDAASRAAAAERARRWREENPSPEELGDSFGSLFSDFVGAVGKVVAGGDWLSLIDEFQQVDASQMDSILRSSDVGLLADELESAQFVQSALKARIERLSMEVKAAQKELDDWERNWRMRDLERPARGGMGKAYGRQLEEDVKRRRAQLSDARRLISEAERRAKLLSERLEVVRSGGTRSNSRTGTGGGTAPRSRLPSVEEELQRMKREMGKL